MPSRAKKPNTLLQYMTIYMVYSCIGSMEKIEVFIKKKIITLAKPRRKQKLSLKVLYFISSIKNKTGILFVLATI